MNKNRINNIIIESIKNDLPNSFGKIGGIEASHVSHYLRTGIAEYVRQDTLATNAGIYTRNKNELMMWCELYSQAVKNLDYVLEWTPDQGDQYVIDKIWKGKEKFYLFDEIEPFDKKQEGWHYFLNDKKILVVSPFEKTITLQANKFDKIWEGAKIKDIITVKSPFPAILTGEEPKSFLYVLNDLQNKISKYSFDFAIVGCGGFSLMLLNFIKNMGKPSLHLGGSTQTLFGIRGKRWDSNFCDKDWYGTEHWIRPLEEETPINKNLVENGCYW